MVIINIDIESSYKENDIGKILYNLVLKYKPNRIVDMGLLHGYSTVFLALGVKHNKKGHVQGCDLFEEYPYKKASRDIIEANLVKYDVQNLVSMEKLSFDDWLKDPKEFDFLHLDISNTGETINKLFNSINVNNKIIVFEGGSIERDNIEWMVKYRKQPMNPLLAKYNCELLTDKFPALSIHINELTKDWRN